MLTTNSNNLQIFNSEEFGQIRTVDIKGKIFFVAKDVATALGYKDTINAIKRHCKWVAKHNLPHPQSRTKTIEVNIIPEGDIYRLVASSELPSAERFESWIFDEVLPTIKKYGTYMTEEVIEKTLTDPDFIIQLATQLKVERIKRLLAEQQLEEAQPKLDKYGVFLDTDGTYTFEQVSKMLSTRSKEEGSKIKVNKKTLPSILRDCEIISKNKIKGRYKNLPNKGFENYFNISSDNDRDDIDSELTRVKTIGIDYIYDILLERKEKGKNLVVMG